jgi:hypothetical protein
MKGILDLIPFIIFLGIVLLSIFGGDALKTLGGLVTGFSPLIVIAILVVIFLATALKIVPEYQRAVIFRLGRVIGAKGPGLFILIPIIDRMVKVDLRTVTLDVPTQDIITKDNVSVSVDAVVYFRVVDPVRAIVEVENYLYATSQIAQTTLRSVCGAVELDELLSEREKLNLQLQEIIDRQTDPWGVKVVAVELKRIDLPEELRRAMARAGRGGKGEEGKDHNRRGRIPSGAEVGRRSPNPCISALSPPAKILRNHTECGLKARKHGSYTPAHRDALLFC